MPILIISCGKAKVWDRQPALGPQPAKLAYTGSLFKLCRRYAEAASPGAWIILSAKYGFLRPDELITHYNVKFGDDADVISSDDLRRQWLEKFRASQTVISLGSREYGRRLAAVLPETVKLVQPLEGQNLFQRSHWLKREIATLAAAKLI